MYPALRARTHHQVLSRSIEHTGAPRVSDAVVAGDRARSGLVKFHDLTDSARVNNRGEVSRIEGCWGVGGIAQRAVDLGYSEARQKEATRHVTQGLIVFCPELL